jgi:hypothetical protein
MAGKNKALLAIIIFALLVVAGCKKNGSSVNTFGAIKSAKSSFRFGVGVYLNVSSSYTYDSQGRPTKMQYYDSLGNATWYRTYTYKGDSLVWGASDSGGLNPGVINTYSLNGQGYIAGSAVGPEVFDYDNLGHCVYHTYQSQIQTNAYSNGNLIATNFNANGISSTITYTYLTDKTEYRNYGFAAYLGPPYCDYGMGELSGKNNANLINISISGFDTVVYTYQFDSKGRVIQEQQQPIGSDTILQTVSYTYFN